jgi:hypothetical protein
MRRKLYYVVWGLVALVPIACGQASGDPVSAAHYPFQLTSEEIALARGLAEKDLIVDSLPSGPRMVFVKVDLLPPGPEDSTELLVMVHHYQYHTDLTVFTMIDLTSRQVLSREFHEHYPTALAVSEAERAMQLARADERLQSVLGPTSTHLEVRPLQYADPHEPLFGHRVAHVLLGQNGNYLASPRVLVDLTTETVHLE